MQRVEEWSARISGARDIMLFVDEFIRNNPYTMRQKQIKALIHCFAYLPMNILEQVLNKGEILIFAFNPKGDVVEYIADGKQNKIWQREGNK